MESGSKRPENSPFVGGSRSRTPEIHENQVNDYYWISCRFCTAAFFEKDGISSVISHERANHSEQVNLEQNKLIFKLEQMKVDVFPKNNQFLQEILIRSKNLTMLKNDSGNSGLKKCTSSPDGAGPRLQRRLDSLTTHYCTICFKVFKDKEMLRSHVKLCKRTSPNNKEDALTEKLSTQQLSSFLACELCLYIGSNRTDLISHREMIHKIVSPPAGSNSTSNEQINELRNVSYSELLKVSEVSQDSDMDSQPDDSVEEEECEIYEQVLETETDTVQMQTEHSCNYCLKLFPTLVKLHVHQRLHTGDLPYKCNVCGKKFSRDTSYYRHIKLHDGIAYRKENSTARINKYGGLKCRYCNLLCANQGGRTMHENTFHRREKYQKQTKVLFDETKKAPHHDGYRPSSRVKDLQLHARLRLAYKTEVSKNLMQSKRSNEHELEPKITENQIKDSPTKEEFKCEFCFKVFRSKKHVRRHEASHKNEKFYYCIDCGKCYKAMSSLARHSKIHHGKLTTQQIPQERPDHSESTISNTNTTSPKTKNSHPCTICGKSFSLRRGLWRHRRTHNGKVTLRKSSKIKIIANGGVQCNYCQAVLANKTGSTLHMKHFHPENFREDERLKVLEQRELPKEAPLEEKERPISIEEYKCRFCLRAFPSEQLVKSHEESHRNYKCTICGRNFIMMSSLMRHLPHHRPPASVQSSILPSVPNKNKIIETGLVQCSFCPAKFASKAGKRTHEVCSHREKFLRQSSTATGFFNCRFCNVSTFTLNGINLHEKNEHMLELNLLEKKSQEESAAVSTKNHLKESTEYHNEVHPNIIIKSEIEERNSELIILSAESLLESGTAEEEIDPLQLPETVVTTGSQFQAEGTFATSYQFNIDNDDGYEDEELLDVDPLL